MELDLQTVEEHRPGRNPSIFCSRSGPSGAPPSTRWPDLPPAQPSAQQQQPHPSTSTPPSISPRHHGRPEIQGQQTSTSSPPQHTTPHTPHRRRRRRRHDVDGVGGRGPQSMHRTTTPRRPHAGDESSKDPTSPEHQKTPVPHRRTRARRRRGEGPAPHTPTPTTPPPPRRRRLGPYLTYIQIRSSPTHPSPARRTEGEGTHGSTASREGKLRFASLNCSLERSALSLSVLVEVLNARGQ